MKYSDLDEMQIPVARRVVKPRDKREYDEGMQRSAGKVKSPKDESRMKQKQAFKRLINVDYAE